MSKFGSFKLFFENLSIELYLLQIDELTALPDFYPTIFHFLCFPRFSNDIVTPTLDVTNMLSGLNFNPSKLKTVKFKFLIKKALS